MSTELETLARRAKACPRWRWMEGMAARNASSLGVYASQSRVVGKAAAKQVPGNLVPDLSDPATLGCLLALVREAWDSPSAYAMPWGVSPQSGTPGGWSMMITPDDTLPTAKLSAPTEAAALVAALEAAP